MSVGLGTFLNDVYLSEYEITLIKSIFTYFPVIYGLGWINTVLTGDKLLVFALVFLFHWLSENPG